MARKIGLVKLMAVISASGTSGRARNHMPVPRLCTGAARDLEPEVVGAQHAHAGPQHERQHDQRAEGIAQADRLPGMQVGGDDARGGVEAGEAQAAQRHPQHAADRGAERFGAAGAPVRQ